MTSGSILIKLKMLTCNHINLYIALDLSSNLIGGKDTTQLIAVQVA